jgi:hypothetical protein
LGPVLMKSCTRVPFFCSVPPAGSVRIACPAGIERDDSSCRVYSNPASLRSLAASFSVLPFTSGTIFVPGPLETRSTTVLFSATLSPAAGSWLTTLSGGASLATGLTSLLRFRRASSATACGAGLPTMFGTSTSSSPPSANASATPPSRSSSRSVAHGHQRRRPPSSSSPAIAPTTAAQAAVS